MKVEFELGWDSVIQPGATPINSKGHWRWFITTTAIPFDWSQIDRVRFISTQNMNPLDYFNIDGLQFPNAEVFSIQQDAVSQFNYGTRMREIYRPDIANQIELDAFSARKLAELKDPKETIVRAVTRGQCPNNYAAQSLDVVAPQFGIGGPAITNVERYRILRLHHRVVKNSDDSAYPGFTFTTEYELAKNQVTIHTATNTQLIDQPQVMLTGRPDWSTQEKRRLLERYRKRAGTFYPTP